jgi:hypothetical protein
MQTAEGFGSRARRSISVAVVAVLTIAPFSRETGASLVSLSSPFGPDTITLDTATNLEWLDVPLTLGLSINQVTAQLGPGDTYAGFRYASSSEIGMLFTDAGLTLGFTTNPIYVPPAQALLSLLGQTGSQPTPGGPAVFAQGWDSDTTGGYNNIDVLQIQPVGPPGNPVCAPAGCVYTLIPGLSLPPADGSHAFDNTGSFLVRSVAPIPEPTTLAMLGIGLAGLAASRRRKQ